MISKVYILLVNYNGWKDSIECLESILKSDYQHYQIIIVDNASVNDSMEQMRNWVELKSLNYIFYTHEEALKITSLEQEQKYVNPIVFIQAEKNGGFAAGNNLGIQYALMKNDFKYIWLLNNDTTIEKRTLSSLVSMAIESRHTLWSSRLLHTTGRIQADGGKINQFFLTTRHIHADENVNQKLEVVEPDYLVGASLLIEKDCINDVGLLAEEYFLYYEDLDYSLRAREKGYNLKVSYESRVFHKESASTKKEDRLFIIDLYFRNKIKFAKKFKYNVFFVKVGMLISILKRLVSFRFQEIKIIIPIILKNSK